MRIFIFILAFTTMICAQSFAQEEMSVQEELSIDEYKDVKPGLLLPDAKIAPEDIQPEEEIEAMSIEDIMKAYGEGKYDTVVKYFMPLAKNGHHQAEEMIGIMYRRGQGGLPKNQEQAFYWLARAAEANRGRAQHYLGIMYFLGEGVIADPVRALMWLYIASVHYDAGQERERAVKDRDNVYARLNRRERERAVEMARDWLDKRNEAYLLDVR